MKKFKIYLLVVSGIAVILFGISFLVANLSKAAYAAGVPDRNNTVCKTDQRVFDYADILTDKEEAKLEKLIAKREKQVGLDIVIVTICEDVGSDPYDATRNRTINFAENFYDYMGFGYDGHVSFKNNDEYLKYLSNNGMEITSIDRSPNPYTQSFCVGAGVIWVDNWYDLNGYAESAILSYRGVTDDNTDAFMTYMPSRDTDGSATKELEKLVWSNVNYDPYHAYRNFVNQVALDMVSMNLVETHVKIGWLISAAFVGSLIFMLVNLRSRLGKRTTDKSTYVAGNSIQVVDRRDRFISKSVTKTRINTSSGSGGGGGGGGFSGGGGGGGHSGGGGRH